MTVTNHLLVEFDQCEASLTYLSCFVVPSIFFFCYFFHTLGIVICYQEGHKHFFGKSACVLDKIYVISSVWEIMDVNWS